MQAFRFPTFEDDQILPYMGCLNLGREGGWPLARRKWCWFFFGFLFKKKLDKSGTEKLRPGGRTTVTQCVLFGRGLSWNLHFFRGTPLRWQKSLGIVCLKMFKLTKPRWNEITLHEKMAIGRRSFYMGKLRTEILFARLFRSPLQRKVQQVQYRLSWDHAFQVERRIAPFVVTI